ncbi:MAG: T9SS type A sorting domain-containing protein [Cytophagaceae bacterium]|nr:T9SS type A sorting domain-containing protein [Cytophagaceae bacterium]
MQKIFNAYKIHYTIPAIKTGLINVSIEIRDLLGRIVKTLLEEARTSGTYDLYFDLSSIPPGIYFYVIRINEKIFECRCIKIG